jgi:branched-subunit amino acid ABC-type transport system permease component
MAYNEPRPSIVKDTAMSPLAHALLDPIFGTVTIIAFLAVIGTIVWLLTEKTDAGRRFMAWIDNMGLSEEQIEDPYNGFRIHPNNYVKSR